jgi:two-component system sensor histidine kinase/response regulator
LIISKRIANLMGGDVGVTSQEGIGSTFWATVRLRRAVAGL